MQLAENEIHLWLSDLQEVNHALLPDYRQLMSAAELARNRRYRLESARVADCVTRALARTVLSRYVDVDPAAWQFSKNEHGKPEIDNPPTALPLRFNLSHSKRYVVCAVGLQHDLGVDIEHTGRDNNVLDIAHRYFSEQEVEALFALPDAERQPRFFDYWTLKEAYMKASGEGISLGLGNFSFRFSAGGEIGIQFGEKIDDNPEQWHFWLHSLGTDHRLAVALKGERSDAFRLRLFKTLPLATSVAEPITVL